MLSFLFLHLSCSALIVSFMPWTNVLLLGISGVKQHQAFLTTWDSCLFTFPHIFSDLPSSHALLLHLYFLGHPHPLALLFTTLLLLFKYSLSYIVNFLIFHGLDTSLSATLLQSLRVSTSHFAKLSGCGFGIMRVWPTKKDRWPNFTCSTYEPWFHTMTRSDGCTRQDNDSSFGHTAWHSHTTDLGIYYCPPQTRCILRQKIRHVAGMWTQQIKFQNELPG